MYFYHWPHKPIVAASFEEIEDFESGSDGTNYTSTSGIADGGTGLGSGTAVYSAAASANGSLGLRVTSTVDSLLLRNITFGGSPSTTEMWCRAVVKMGIPDNASSMDHLQIRDASGVLVAVLVTDAGEFRILDGATARGTSTYAVNGTDFVQVSFGFEGGQVKLRLYDMAGDLIEAETTGTYSGSTTPETLRFGIISTPVVTPFVVDFDEVGYNTTQELTPIAQSLTSVSYFGIPMA